MTESEIIQKKFSDITKDELYYLFITLSYGYDHIAHLFGYNSNTAVRRKVKKFNIIKTEDQRLKTISNTRSINKQSKQIKPVQVKKPRISNGNKCRETWKNKTDEEKKLIREKIKKTCLEKYGVDNPMKLKEVKEKLKQSNLEKYGVDNYMKTDAGKALTKQMSSNPAVIEKKKSTCRNKYGVDFPFQSEDLLVKANQSIQNKYGVANASQIDIVKEKVLQKRISYLNSVYNRESWQSDIFLSKEKFTEYLSGLPAKPSIHDISIYLGYDDCSIDKKINEYDLRDFINFNPGYSSYETTIVQWLNDNNITNIERNNKTILDGKEIDIYLPDYKIGIEFNGNYWHSEFKKENVYHQNKSLLAESKNIFIYNIFEYEWEDENKKQKILNQLKNILQLNSEKIYARKCNVQIVNKKDKKDFININHIQGDSSSSIDIGLYYNTTLVAVMTFSKPRFNKNCNYELVRYCSKSNTNIIGGASKLFKYFINNYMKTGEKCVSYSDISKTKGNIYSRLGFLFVKIEYPNYVWCNGHNILSRYKCQMKNEIETMHNNNYFRIFDSGTKTWIYTKEN